MGIVAAGETILRKCGNLLGKVVGAVFVVVIIVIGFKSEITVTWKSPNTPASYSVFEPDDRWTQIVLLPENKAIVWYEDPKHDFSQGNLVQWRGYVGTHYVWRIWNIGDNDSTFGPGLLGIRIYPEGTTPAVLNTEVLAHHISGSETLVLPRKGDRIRQQTVLFSDEAIRFQDMWFEKDKLSKAELDEDINHLLAFLGPGKPQKQ